MGTDTVASSEFQKYDLPGVREGLEEATEATGPSGGKCHMPVGSRGQTRAARGDRQAGHMTSGHRTEGTLLLRRGNAPPAVVLHPQPATPAQRALSWGKSYANWNSVTGSLRTKISVV